MSSTFLTDRGSICTVLYVLDHAEMRVRVGNEELTPRDLAKITVSIKKIDDKRAIAARPVPVTPTSRPRAPRRP